MRIAIIMGCGGLGEIAVIIIILFRGDGGDMAAIQIIAFRLTAFDISRENPPIIIEGQAVVCFTE